MLDLRIYRMALVPVVLAVIVLAFSLGNQQGALSTNLAPDAYVGSNAMATMNRLAHQYPSRRPGSAGDRGVAGYVASQLAQYGFSVSRYEFSSSTVDGSRLLENVVGTRAGLIPGTIAIVTSRDSLSAPGRAALSGTAVMLELARLLHGETQNHTIVLASTSGSVGALGAAQLVHELPGPIDALIALGDLAGRSLREPVVVPWSGGQQLAPTMLRNTVAGAVEAQTGVAVKTNDLGGQIVHLAFPLASSPQAVFGSAGVPAVLVSLSGDRPVPAGEPVSPARITGTGRGVLQALHALDGGRTVSAPSAYLLWSGKVIPAWAVRLLVLALIAPVAAATIDGLARGRRRQIPLLRSTAWVLSSAAPFVAAAAIIGLARLAGLIRFAPGILVPGGSVPLGAGGLTVLALIAVAIAGGLLLLRPRLASRDPDGASVALLAVLCAVALSVWLMNPFAAILLLPSLHLWMWIAAGRQRLPMAVVFVILGGGLVLPALAALYYAVTLGVGPVGLAWSWALLLAGGAVRWSTAVEWSIFAGCTVSMAVLALRARRAPAPEPAPITIRGPVTYAGPGSLGGTSSALRR